MNKKNYLLLPAASALLLASCSKMGQFSSMTLLSLRHLWSMLPVKCLQRLVQVYLQNS